MKVAKPVQTAWSLAMQEEPNRTRAERRRLQENGSHIVAAAHRLRVFFDIDVDVQRVKGGWVITNSRHGVIFGPAEGRHILAFLAGLQWGPTCRKI